MIKLELILCEKCNNYDFFECDEDGVWEDGCRNPNIKTEFYNWRRIYKCKYYTKIPIQRFRKATKRQLSYLVSSLFHFRDGKFLGKLNKATISHIQRERERYLAYRDYLLNELGGV